MKKIGIFLLALLLGVMLTGCTDPEEIDTALDTYCENNPESTICTNPEAARNEIVANMFNTIMIEFVDGTNATFCDDYFAHDGLIDTCSNNRFGLLPDDYGDLSGDIEVNPLSNNSDFEVLTVYGDGSDAYTFDISVIEVEGVIKFTAFSYTETGVAQNPNDGVVDLEITDEQVRFFMRDFILYYNATTFDCADMLVDNALASCLTDTMNVIGPMHTMQSTEVTKISTNKFLYKGYSNDGLQVTAYTITFTKDGDTLVAKELSYVQTGTYNTLPHATTLMTEFTTKYNDSYYTMSGLCEDYFLVGSVAETCYDTLEPVKLNNVTLDSVIQTTTGVFEATLSFDDTNATEVVITFSVVVGDYGYYYFDATFGDSGTVVVEDPSEISLEEIKNLMTWVNDYQYHESIDYNVCDYIATSNPTLISDCNADNVVVGTTHWNLIFDTNHMVKLADNTYRVVATNMTQYVTETFDIEFEYEEDEWLIKDISSVVEYDISVLDLDRELFRFYGEYNAGRMYAFCYKTQVNSHISELGTCPDDVLAEIDSGFFIQYIGVEPTDVSNEIIVEYYKYDETTLNKVTDHIRVLPYFDDEYIFYAFERTTEVLSDDVTTAISLRFDAFFEDYFDASSDYQTLFDAYLKDGYDYENSLAKRTELQTEYSSIMVNGISYRINSLEDIVYTINLTATTLDGSTTNFDMSGQVWIEDDEIMLFDFDEVEYAISFAEANNILVHLNEALILSSTVPNSQDVLSLDYRTEIGINDGAIDRSVFPTFHYPTVDVIRLEGNTFIVRHSAYNDIGAIYFVPEEVVELIIEDGVIKIASREDYVALTETEVMTVVEEYTNILTDNTLSDSDFCIIYDLGPNCATIRSEVVDNDTFAVTSIEEVVVDGTLTQEVTYTYTNDVGQEETLVVYIEVIDDGQGGYTYGETGWKDEGIDNDCDLVCPECEDCVDQVCDGLITNEILLEVFFEGFFDDYNNGDISNQAFGDTYGIPTTSQLVMERDDVILNGGAVLSNVVVHYVDSEFDYVEVSYTLILASVLYEDTNYLKVYTDMNRTFLLEEVLTYERVAIDTVINETTADVIIRDYFDNITGSMTEQAFCDLYYQGTSSCVPLFDYMQENNEYIINSVSDVSTDGQHLFEVDYFQVSPYNVVRATVVYAIEMNQDATYDMVEISRQEVPVSNGQVIPMRITYDEFNTLVLDFFATYNDVTISSSVYCETTLNDTNFDGSTGEIDSFTMNNCVSDRDQYLNQYLDVDIIRIELMGVTEYLVNGASHYWVEITFTGDIGTHSVDLQYYGSLRIYSIDDTVKGDAYLMDFGYPVWVNPNRDTYFESLSTLYADWTVSHYDFCNAYHSTIPGSRCLSDRISVTGFDMVEYKYYQVQAGYASYDVLYMLQMKFVHPLSGETKFIHFPIEINLSGTTTVSDADYHTYIDSNQYDMDVMIDFSNQMILDLMDTSITDQAFLDMYYYGVDITGEILGARAIMQNTGIDPSGFTPIVVALNGDFIFGVGQAYSVVYFDYTNNQTLLMQYEFYKMENDENITYLITYIGIY